MSDLRMNAYYYSFDETTEPSVNLALSAVACAGKAFHNTESWNDADEANDDHEGGTPVEWIQNAADKAAAELTQFRARIAELDGIVVSLEEGQSASNDAYASLTAQVEALTAERDGAADLLHRCLFGKGEVHGSVRDDINTWLNHLGGPIGGGPER